MHHRRTLATLTLTAGLLLSGCASNDTKTDAAFNDADVDFAQQMIPHHQQALEMAKLAESRATSLEVKDLAAAIEGAQDPEIQTMTGWLQEWDEDVPSLGGMSEHSGHDMAGMMDEDQMADLEAASGAKFDERFLTLMIEHHEGAIEMARTSRPTATTRRPSRWQRASRPPRPRRSPPCAGSWIPDQFTLAGRTVHPMPADPARLTRSGGRREGVRRRRELPRHRLSTDP